MVVRKLLRTGAERICSISHVMLAAGLDSQARASQGLLTTNMVGAIVMLLSRNRDTFI